jgi:hypothetical protein
MRLINVWTGYFEDFIRRGIPKACALSHTWEEEEVSFTDMSDPSRSYKKGDREIEKTRQLICC